MLRDSHLFVPWLKSLGMRVRLLCSQSAALEPRTHKEKGDCTPTAANLPHDPARALCFRQGYLSCCYICPQADTHTRADHTTHGLFASFSHYLSYLTVSLGSLIIRLLGIGTFIHLYLLNQQTIVEVLFVFFFKIPSASLCLCLQSSENTSPILRCIKVMWSLEFQLLLGSRKSPKTNKYLN